MLPVDDVGRVASIALPATRCRGPHRRGRRLKIKTAGRQALPTQRQHLPGLHIAVSPLRHRNEIRSPRHGVSAELLGAVAIRRADDEAAVPDGTDEPVGRTDPLRLGVDARVDHGLPAFFVPRPEGGFAPALAAVDGEDGIREAWPVDADAARFESLGVVCVDPSAVRRCAISCQRGILVKHGLARSYSFH